MNVASRFFTKGALQNSFYRWENFVDILQKEKLQKALEFWTESTLFNVFLSWRKFAQNQKEKYCLDRFETKNATTQSMIPYNPSPVGSSSAFNFRSAYAEPIESKTSSQSHIAGHRFITRIERVKEGIMVTNIIPIRDRTSEELQKVEFEF